VVSGGAGEFGPQTTPDVRRGSGNAIQTNIGFNRLNMGRRRGLVKRGPTSRQLPKNFGFGRRIRGARNALSNGNLAIATILHPLMHRTTNGLPTGAIRAGELPFLTDARIGHELKKPPGQHLR